jgi:hypothetical protein
MMYESWVMGKYRSSIRLSPSILCFFVCSGARQLGDMPHRLNSHELLGRLVVSFRSSRRGVMGKAVRIVRRCLYE